MSDGITMNFKVHFTRGQQGQRLMHVGTKPPPAPVAGGRVPRIARLMALAIRFEDLVRRARWRTSPRSRSWDRSRELG